MSNKLRVWRQPTGKSREPLPFEHQRLIVEMPNGEELRVELFVREGCDGVILQVDDGRLLVSPRCGNWLEVWVEPRLAP